MSLTQEVIVCLEKWETKRFRPNEITFAEAAKSLRTNQPLVVAKPGANQSRWVLMNTNTDKVAILVFVGVYKWGSDLETGNFVPTGKRAPDGIPSDRIQNKPSFKCELTYTFDTSVDSSIWDGLRAFENHVTSNNEFNKGLRPRRKWQDGKRPDERERYQVTSKIFVRRTPFNSKSNGATPVPYTVHPWVSNAVKDTKEIPNPERPQYYDFSDGVLQKLADSADPRFNRNDIIIVSCKVNFVITGDSWYSEIVPLELIRVDRLPDVVDPTSDVSLYPPPDDDFVALEVGRALELFDEHSKSTMKRKQRESEEPCPVPDKRQTLESEPEPEPELETEPEPEAKSEQEQEQASEQASESAAPESAPESAPATESSNRAKLRSKSSRANRL